jgi:threonine synthase
LAGLRGKKNVEVFVLHPHGRVSHIQEKQMTTITDPNVHNISGTPAGYFPVCLRCCTFP